MLEALCLCVSSRELDRNCGYEEALHSCAKVLVLPDKGTRLARR